MYWKNKGVALITALLVVSLAATAAITLTTAQQLDIYRTTNLINGDQAWLYAKGAEEWAMAILVRDLEDNKFDSLDDSWAQTLPPIDLPGGIMIGTIEDMHSRFNLNDLVQGNGINKLALTRFQRLLDLLELDQELAQAVVDWLDKNIEATPPQGAEDDYYIGLENPYLAANRKMSSVTELRLVKGFDQKTYERIAPYVTALPNQSSININTASAQVLASLSSAISVEFANDLVAERKEEPFEKLEDLTSHEQLVDEKLDTKGMGVVSKYFLLHNETRMGNARVRLDTLILRTDKGNVKVIQRHQAL